MESNFYKSKKAAMKGKSKSDKKDYHYQEEPEIIDKKSYKNESATPEKLIKEPKKKMMPMQSIQKSYHAKYDYEPDEILPGIFLGSVGAAYNMKALNENRIKHILCCCGTISPAFPTAYGYKTLDIEDIESEDISRFFEEASSHIHGIVNQRQRILIHCFAGKSRSATIVICYLIRYNGMSVDQALEHVKKRRSCAEPNEGFMKQLRAYEGKVLGV